MHCPVKFWHFDELKVSLYVDDGLGSSTSKTLVIQEAECVFLSCHIRVLE